MKNGREIAYLALINTWKDQGRYLSRYFETCRQDSEISKNELKLAQEIAYGTVRHELALEYLANQLAGQKITGLRNKHKALLYSGLYQLVFMHKVPAYAVVNECVSLAKCYCHRQFANFLNALLRQTGQGIPLLPINNWSIRYSMPEPFIQEWIEAYGPDKTLALLKAFQKVPDIFVRIRTEIPLPDRSLLVKADGVPDNFYRLSEGQSVSSLDQAAAFWYIQNPTPYWLIEQLSQHIKPPATVLDVCCSPGGKLFALHDRFPLAKLVGNDLSPPKMERIQQNLNRLQIEAQLTSFPGEEYPLQQKFDLVIVDVPCSNTGVLHKSPEAKKRLERRELLQTQAALLRRALELVNEEGQIWYLTCSISRDENERQTEHFCEAFGWKKCGEWTVLPNEAGWDGGYGCALKPTGGSASLESMRIH